MIWHRQARFAPSGAATDDRLSNSAIIFLAGFQAADSVCRAIAANASRRTLRAVRRTV
jgi:hypothetical protein